MTAADAKQPGLDAPISEWLVYADALQEAHDPRGELITLNHAVESGKMPAAVRDAYVAKHFEALIGRNVKSEDFRITWRHCLIEHADILVTRLNASLTVHNIDTLVSSPAAADVRSLALVGVGEEGERITLPVDKFAARLPKTCTSVHLIDDRADKTTMLCSREFDPDQNIVQIESLDPLFSVPTVAKLHVCVADAAQATPAAINAPNLESFTFHCLRWGVDPYDGETPRITDVVTNAIWPKLEELELRLAETWSANIADDAGAYIAQYAGKEDWEDRLVEADDGENEGVDWDQLADLLEALKKVPLKRLALTSFHSSSSLLSTIAVVGLPDTLEELDLSDSSVSDAAWFESNKALIAPLKRLRLERTSMPEADAKSLVGLGPEILHSYDGRGARYRYVVGSE